MSVFSSSSSASCPSIAYLFWHRVQLLLSSLASWPDFPHLPRHRLQASLIFFGIVSGFHYLFWDCLDFPHLPWHRVRASLIFFGIASGFFLAFLNIVSEHCLSFQHRILLSLYFPASCMSIAYLFRHRARISLSLPASCPDFPQLPQHRVRTLLIFFGIASDCLLSSMALCLYHSPSQSSCLGFS